MRTLRLIALLLLCAPLATRADEDPPGTEQIIVPLNGTTKIQTSLQGTRAVCDDAAVVSPELTDEGLVLRGLALGSTLCGLRGNTGQLVGMLRVTVVTAVKPKPKPAPAKPKKVCDDPDQDCGANP